MRFIINVMRFKGTPMISLFVNKGGTIGVRFIINVMRFKGTPMVSL